MARIKAGEKVAWRSSSGGTTKRKEGTVLAFVSAWQDARTVLLTKIGDLPPSSRIRVQPSTFRSSIDRYLVAVSDGRKDVYYLPRAEVVEKQNPNAERS